MQLSSTTGSLGDLAHAVANYLETSDESTMSGEVAARELEALVDIVRKLSWRQAALGAQAIANNHHNTVGARSGAAWLASVMGTSERAAADKLGALRAMEMNPDVAIAAESGELSFEKATLIARLAKNKVAFTEELMAHASEPYEALRRRGLDLSCKDRDYRRTRRTIAGFTICRSGRNRELLPPASQAIKTKRGQVATEMEAVRRRRQ